MRLQKLLGKGGRLGGATPDMKGKRRGDILADVSLGALLEGGSTLMYFGNAGGGAKDARRKDVRRRGLARPSFRLSEGGPTSRDPRRDRAVGARQPDLLAGRRRAARRKRERCASELRFRERQRQRSPRSSSSPLLSPTKEALNPIGRLRLEHRNPHSRQTPSLWQLFPPCTQTPSNFLLLTPTKSHFFARIEARSLSPETCERVTETCERVGVPYVHVRK